MEGSFSCLLWGGVLGPGHCGLGAGSCRVPGQDPDTGEGSLSPDLGAPPGQQVRPEGTGPPSLAIPEGEAPEPGGLGAVSGGWWAESSVWLLQGAALPSPVKRRTGRI